MEPGISDLKKTFLDPVGWNIEVERESGEDSKGMGTL